MSNEPPVIRFENVNLSYGQEDILEDFSLHIQAKEFLTVIGSSGCGKTTMMKLINGLLRPQTGQVYVEEENLENQDITALRRRIGYVVQEIALFPHMTVEKNITYVPELGKKADKAALAKEVDNMMSWMGLEPSLKKKYPSELSGGQRQRVGIARALIARPSILLMDEPFGAVDGITRKRLQSEIVRIHKALGVTIIFVTHDIQEALKIGTKVLVMNEGRIEQYGLPEEIRRAPASDFVRQLVQD